MKLFKIFHEFEISATGGIAIYMLLSSLFVLVVGCYGLFQMIWRMFK